MQGFKTIKYKYALNKDELGLMDMRLTLKELLDKYKAKKINFYDEPTMRAYILEIEAEEAL